MLSFHSEFPVEVTVQDAVQTDLDTRVTLLVTEKFGHEVKKSKQGYRLQYTFSDKINAYSYSVQNIKDKPLTIRLDCSKSENMLFSTPTGCLTQTIQPGETTFYMHSMAIPSKEKFKRVSECKVMPDNVNNQQE